MVETLTILLGLVGAAGAYLAWRSIRRQRSIPSRPSAGELVKTCRREFRYLVDKYGFTVEPLVLSGVIEPFGARFQGPNFALIVQGIQWGSSIDVYLQTGDPEADDEMRMRSQLPAHWLLDQRLPGWRSRRTENDQLAEIRNYAAVLRRCADDLFSGDLSALSELFVSYAEHRRQQDIQFRQEMEDSRAQQIAWEKARPRSVSEQMEIVQKTHKSIGYLRAECRVLLKVLSKSSEADSLLRFAESWQNLAECLKREVPRFAYVQSVEASPGIVEGLRNAETTAAWVQAALASGQVGHSLTERVAALDHQGKELLLDLDLAFESLSRMEAEAPHAR